MGRRSSRDLPQRTWTNCPGAWKVPRTKSPTSKDHGPGVGVQAAHLRDHADGLFCHRMDLLWKRKDKREEWSEEANRYLDSLSPLQRKIAFLLSDNNTPNEICEELHITLKHFENSMKRILADERIKSLRPLVERI